MTAEFIFVKVHTENSQTDKIEKENSMTLINKLQVERFRGIRDLHIDRLAQINLIVGDNNCGKTSLLEAVQLLRNPGSIPNLYELVKRRNIMTPLDASSLYDNIISMFPKDGDNLKIQLSCEYDGNIVSYVLLGKESTESQDAGQELDQTKTDVLNLKFDCKKNGSCFYCQNKELNRAKRSEDVGTGELIKINYTAPYEYIRSSKLKRITREAQYKESCLQALQLFDPDIEDMTGLSDDNTSQMEYLKHKRLGTTPLSSYGDGIKKTLALFNAIIGAENGVLLIDEIETSIHMQYYEDIFRFLVNACKEFNVQAFITTHSIEAVDGLLNTQDYENHNAEDDIMVVTLDREKDKTYSRVLPGRRVFKARESFDFEVRL